jgi:hypothetical protein
MALAPELLGGLDHSELMEALEPQEDTFCDLTQHSQPPSQFLKTLILLPGRSMRQ